MRAIILMGLLAQLLVSCDRARIVEDVFWGVHEYENLSGKDIKLKIFQRGVLKNVDLPRSKIYKDSASIGGGSNVLITNADSLIMTYDNDRKQSFYNVLGINDISDRNPIVGGKRKEMYKSKRKIVMRFTFTPQDYENATPCNGKCN